MGLIVGAAVVVVGALGVVGGVEGTDVVGQWWNRPSTKEANAFLATSATLSLAAVETLVVEQNSPPVLWIVGGLVVAALVVLDVLIYTLLAADWVARWKLHDEEARRRFDELAQVARVPARLTPRQHGPGRRRRRVAGRMARGG